MYGDNMNNDDYVMDDDNINVGMDDDVDDNNINDDDNVDNDDVDGIKMNDNNMVDNDDMDYVDDSKYCNFIDQL